MLLVLKLRNQIRARYVDEVARREGKQRATRLSTYALRVNAMTSDSELTIKTLISDENHTSSIVASTRTKCWL